VAPPAAPDTRDHGIVSLKGAGFGNKARPGFLIVATNRTITLIWPYSRPVFQRISKLESKAAALSSWLIDLVWVLDGQKSVSSPGRTRVEKDVWE
jgi:hypothetical protein